MYTLKDEIVITSNDWGYLNALESEERPFSEDEQWMAMELYLLLNP